MWQSGSGRDFFSDDKICGVRGFTHKLQMEQNFISVVRDGKQPRLPLHGMGWK